MSDKKETNRWLKKGIFIIGLLFICASGLMAASRSITWKWTATEPRVSHFRYQLDGEDEGKWTVIDAAPEMSYTLEDAQEGRDYILYIQQSYNGHRWSASQLNPVSLAGVEDVAASITSAASDIETAPAQDVDTTASASVFADSEHEEAAPAQEVDTAASASVFADSEHEEAAPAQVVDTAASASVFADSEHEETALAQDVDTAASASVFADGEHEETAPQRAEEQQGAIDFILEIGETSPQTEPQSVVKDTEEPADESHDETEDLPQAAQEVVLVTEEADETVPDYSDVPLTPADELSDGEQSGQYVDSEETLAILPVDAEASVASEQEAPAEETLATDFPVPDTTDEDAVTVGSTESEDISDEFFAKDVEDSATLETALDSQELTTVSTDESVTATMEEEPPADLPADISVNVPSDTSDVSSGTPVVPQKTESKTRASVSLRFSGGLQFSVRDNDDVKDNKGQALFTLYEKTVPEFTLGLVFDNIMPLSNSVGIGIGMYGAYQPYVLPSTTGNEILHVLGIGVMSRLRFDIGAVSLYINGSMDTLSIPLRKEQNQKYSGVFFSFFSPVWSVGAGVAVEVQKNVSVGLEGTWVYHQNDYRNYAGARLFVESRL
ncbi:hypothetical protein [Parasphaerochaeta coccoides]|uniref:Uncharacterized protein n=1 Tax=Parasphaerochaeta coccoides (strain ATCC BAA-1237 / DSM 17374 / SPN1) TaxID=760011 RepID=F4GHQ8_PARC1|nr:hypothetical protein [Parasphaerochaeta coccoides]AEC01596.1 hypothetical protein Spico_0367 [Parasphaerochaeta coccoides DSM 17374]